MVLFQDASFLMVGTVIGELSACSSEQDPDGRLFVPVSGGYLRPPEGMFFLVLLDLD